MRVLNYSDWQETSHTMQMILQMILQMMGKVKAKEVPARPERKVGALQMLATGFSTGLIPNASRSFDLLLHMKEASVSARALDGSKAGFSLQGEHSVAEYYDRFLSMLKAIDVEAEVDQMPEGTANGIAFEKQTEKKVYSDDCAYEYYKMCVFVRNALLEFAAPFRGKKTLPALNWETLRMGTKLFSGEKDSTDDEVDSSINERYIEFGFSPGDEGMDEPHVFICPHSSADIDYSGVSIRPVEASYRHDRGEFYLDLRPVMRYPNSSQIINSFCRDAFVIIAGTEGWEQKEWFARPGR